MSVSRWKYRRRSRAGGDDRIQYRIVVIPLEDTMFANRQSSVNVVIWAAVVEGNCDVSW